MDWEFSAADKVAPDAGEKYDISTDVTPLFIGNAGFDEHFRIQTESRVRYAAAICALESNGIDLSQSEPFSSNFDTCSAAHAISRSNGTLKIAFPRF